MHGCFQTRLNKDKSEVLVISSIHRPRPTLSSVDLCNETVLCSVSARNIGVILDQSLSMKTHVNAVCKSSFFHLRNIGFIRKYLTPDSVKIIVHTLNTSKPDYCNSLLCGLLIIFKSNNTFRTQQPVSSPSPQDSAILLLSSEISLVTSSSLRRILLITYSTVQK